MASQNGVETDESQEQEEGTDKDEATPPLLWVNSENIGRIQIYAKHSSNALNWSYIRPPDRHKHIKHAKEGFVRYEDCGVTLT